MAVSKIVQIVMKPGLYTPQVTYPPIAFAIDDKGRTYVWSNDHCVWVVAEFHAVVSDRE
jgi:hypothetical protein